MKLNKNSWHYKLWRKSFTFDERAPEETDLCRYCHKVFWQLVSYAALASMVVTLVIMCLWGLYLFIVKGLGQHTLLTLEIVAGIAATVTALVLYVRWLTRGRSYREPKTLVGKFAHASKQRVCPLVEFTDSDEE
jgi:hypothetical protein